MARGLQVGTIENGLLYIDPAAMAALNGGGGPAQPGPAPQQGYPMQQPYPVQQGFQAAPAAPVMNWLQTLAGGAQLVAGVIRDRRLNFLSNTVRDKRDALDASKVAAEKIVNIDPSKTAFDAQGALKAQMDVDNKIEDVMTAQAYLDRAQNQAELWQAAYGAANLGVGLGFGQGYGVPYGLQQGFQQQQPYPVQSYPVQPGYPMMGGAPFGGGMGPFLGGAAGGLLGGAIGAGAFNNGTATNNRP